MGPAKWLQRTLKQRRHCHSLSPTQLDSFAQFNMTKTQAIFPNSSCRTGPCATLNRISLRVLVCLLDWQRLVTWIQTHPLCAPFYVLHTNMCPISAFPSAWNILHIHERNSFPENPQLSSIAKVNNLQGLVIYFFYFHLNIPGLFFKENNFQPNWNVPMQPIATWGHKTQRKLIKQLYWTVFSLQMVFLYFYFTWLINHFLFWF